MQNTKLLHIYNNKKYDFDTSIVQFCQLNINAAPQEQKHLFPHK